MTEPNATPTQPNGTPPNGTPPADPAAEAHAKRQQEIRETGAKIRAEAQKDREAAAKERAALAAELKSVQEWRAAQAEEKKRRDLALTDPDAYLKPIYGDDWPDKLAKARTGDQSALSIQKLREEIRAEFEGERKARAEAEAKQKEEDAKLAEADKKEAEAQAARELEAFQKETTETVMKSAAEYPTLVAVGVANHVALRIQAEYEKSGKVLEVPEVAKQIEAELDTVIEKVLATPKWKEKLKAARLSELNGRREVPVVPKLAPRTTLSADMSAGTQTPRRPLTREERRQAVMAKVESGELKLPMIEE